MIDPPGSYVPLRKLNWRLVIGLFGVLFVCLFNYKYLAFVANREPISPLVPLIEEGGGVLAALLLFPGCYWVAVHFPLTATTWWKNLPVHLITVCSMSFLLTSAMALQRNILFPLAGLGKYNYGYMPVRYLMEFSNHFMVYWMGVALIYLFHHVRFARERELNEAKLEANLAEARLQNLRLQLDPHFLFNTLNAISTAVYENPSVADEMIGKLSTLLRHLLVEDRSQEIPLARELELLNLYTSIMQARFEERLQISTDIDPSVEDALVPQFLLQPLVENAIRHGVDPQTLRVTVSVRARTSGDQLTIIVRDHGPGFGNSGHQSGIGLQNTAERLERLYGNKQSLRMRNGEEGGAVVEITIPLSRIPTSTSHTVADTVPA